jgi:hypothetical protein
MLFQEPQRFLAGFRLNAKAHLALLRGRNPFIA